MKIALVSNDFNFRLKDGISRYSYELYKYLSRKHEVFLYTFEEAGSFWENVSRGLKRLVGIRIREDVDLVHLFYPNAVFPITAKPVIVTWHDTDLFTRYRSHPFSPEFYHWLGVVWPAIRNTKRADGLIYVSDETKRALAKYMNSGLSGKQHKVIPNGIDQEFVEARILKGVDRKDFVFVGSVHFAHKNVAFLIKSFVEASPKGHDLYIFTPTDRERIPEEFFKYKNVHIIIKAPTSTIIKKLSRSVALLHFSKLEGFGVPILEAIAVGTPAVILKDANIPEVTAKYAIKVSESGAAEMIRKLAKEKPELSDEAIAYAKSFSWERSARETETFYNKVMSSYTRS